MKCNNCGIENADSAAFCSACGASLQPGITVAAPIDQNGTVVSGQINMAGQSGTIHTHGTAITGAFGDGGPTVSASTPIKNKKLAFVLIVLILVLIGGGVIAALLFNTKSTTYVCKQETDLATISVAGTFKRNQLSSLEITLITEDDSESYASSRNSSHTTNGITVTPYEGVTVTTNGATITDDSPAGDDWFFDTSNDDWDYMGSQDTMSVFVISMLLASIEEYADEPGIDYYKNEREGLATYAATIDYKKLSDKAKKGLPDDLNTSISPEEFQKSYTESGLTCSRK